MADIRQAAKWMQEGKTVASFDSRRLGDSRVTRVLFTLVVEITDLWRRNEAAVCDGLLVWALPTLCVLMGRITRG